MRIFPENLSILWNLWEIRVMVLSSLMLQAILMLFGNWRKFSTSKWLKLLWLAYLSADWVATVSLSILSSSSNSKENGIKSVDPNQVLSAFWAPFLLLHLGGQDTITAYSLEDNELWWRHLLVLVVQVTIAFYVILRAWTDHALNYLAIPIFAAGIIKFAERTWVFRSASSKHFRESMFADPDPGPNYSKFMDEYLSKKNQGLEVNLGRVIEVPTGADYSFTPTAPNIISNAANLRHAHHFFEAQFFKRLFADLVLGISEIFYSQSFFKNRSSDDAFKVIEIELGFMYDLFYTKAVLYNAKGAFLRFISSVTVISVSVAFLIIIDTHDYKRENVIITYILLAGAVILEVSAGIKLLCSDWAMLWLSKFWEVGFLYPVVSPLLSSSAQRKRWSNMFTRYNLLRPFLEEKPAKIPWRSKMSKKPEVVPGELKELIFQQLLKKSKSATEFGACKELCARRGDWVLINEGLHEKLRWSIEEEFDKSILLWHIATDVCYYDDMKKYSNKFHDSNCEDSKMLSEYMFYLLVKRPFMLPNGIAKIRLKDTCAEANKFFEQRNCTRNYELACENLLEVSTVIRPAEIKGDKSKSVLFDACRLAKALQSLEKKEKWENTKKWELMSHVWVEMLCYAASQCRWNHHGQQLRRGGELLTHVWFLMAHLGITEQREKGHSRAMFNVW
ncbi:hypothetical protein ABKV19_009369 [Rosa sericea]